jgi:hypothetical protein
MLELVAEVVTELVVVPELVVIPKLIIGLGVVVPPANGKAPKPSYI